MKTCHRSTANPSTARVALLGLLVGLALPLSRAEAAEPIATASQSKVAAATGANAPADGLTQELRWLKAERVVITSVSKREQDPFTSAAAVTVISGEEIRRSGARSVPEALRLAPGMSVAQMDANKWAVTARGFNSRFADKLLVLIDGRSVYTPTFSGVFWDTQDYLFEDIERIEVIRGPGGTIWGANAVNGVINIITKNARDTRGTFVSGGFGTEERGFGEFRYGSRLGESGFLRGYFKYRSTDNLESGFDSWDFMQGGVRGDWEFGPTKLSLNADSYYGNIKEQPITSRLPAIPFSGPVIATVNESYRVHGQSVVARVEHELSDENSLQLQAYYDRAERTVTLYDGYRNTFDLDFQHHFPLPWRQSFTYGFGYRYLPDHFRNPDPTLITWVPAERNWQLATAFVQDEIELVEDKLRLTLGTKFEHNDFTGFEFQPSARLALTPNSKHTVWGSATRALQVPGRNLDGVRNIGIPSLAAAPLSVLGSGNPNVKSTELLAYELGHRWQPTDSVSLDTAVFYHHYNRLVDGEATVNFGNATVLNTAINRGTADSYGFEVSSKWHVNDWWRLTGAYSWLRVDLHDSTTSLFGEGRDPRNQVSLRSSFDLPRNVELDLWSRYVSRLPSLGVPAYFDLDARLGWHATKNVEFAIVGQNLIAPRRIEFAQDQFTPTVVNRVERTVYAQISLRF